ncbi:hypothetical protein K402DRAFT_464842 [Aulographum hederae CBS 113979]|uniref:Uncharacterized protein n=1 Tax=Aulographum hederae CBS 113979 TaxID=1176131 RepID=A0A6G1GVV4_9PEZI|nr:hypothetical protein K402DRAFT_464842 [Aulographum hederae CBS 113979]
MALYTMDWVSCFALGWDQSKMNLERESISLALHQDNITPSLLLRTRERALEGRPRLLRDAPLVEMDAKELNDLDLYRIFRGLQQEMGKEVPPPPIEMRLAKTNERDLESTTTSFPQSSGWEIAVSDYKEDTLNSKWRRYFEAGWDRDDIAKSRNMARARACLYCKGDPAALQSLRIEAGQNRSGNIGGSQSYADVTPRSFDELDDDELYYIDKLLKKKGAQKLESANDDSVVPGHTLTVSSAAKIQSRHGLQQTHTMKAPNSSTVSGTILPYSPAAESSGTMRPPAPPVTNPALLNPAARKTTVPPALNIYPETANRSSQSNPAPPQYTQKRPLPDDEALCTRCTQPLPKSHNPTSSCRFHPGKLQPNIADSYWSNRTREMIHFKADEHEKRHLLYRCCWRKRGETGCKGVPHVSAVVVGKRRRVDEGEPGRPFHARLLRS